MEEDEVTKEKDRELAWETGELGCIPQSLRLICFRISGNHFNSKHFCYHSCPMSSPKSFGPFVQCGDLLSCHRWVFRVSCSIDKELNGKKWCLLPHGERTRVDVVRKQAGKERSASSGSTHVMILAVSWQHHPMGFERQLWNIPRLLFLSIWGCLRKLWAAKKTLGLSVCRISRMIRRHLHCSLTREAIFANIWPGVKYVFFLKTVAKFCGH